MGTNTTNMWLEIGALGAAIGSLGAILAAFAALRAARETKRTVLAQILLQLRATYGSDEMLSGMVTLHQWQEQHGPEFAKKFGALRRSNYSKVEHIDRARRRFTHYLRNFIDLLNAKVVNKTFIRTVVTPKTVKFFFEVIHPLEKEIPTYDTEIFHLFLKTFKNENG